MAFYTCKLGSADGRIIEKEFESANRDVLRKNLEEQGFYVFEVRKKPLQILGAKGLARRKLDNKELLTFNQELLVLIKAGLPIIQALETILDRLSKGKLAEILTVVRDDIKGGAYLSDAFEKHPAAFSHLYVAAVRAGERTGDLPQTLRRYIVSMKRAAAVKRKVLAALMYPTILVVVAFLAISVLLVYVVPTFSQVYAEAGSALPVPTQLLIIFTTTLRNYLLLILAALVGSWFLFLRWKETTAGHYLLDSWKLRVPLLGALITKYAVAGFTRTLATVLQSGIPIVESLKMSVGTLNNKVLERNLLTAITKVEEGMSLSSSLESVRLFPPLALRMLGVGEATGSLEEMLEDISEYFEEEIDQNLQVFTTAVEPAIMIIMGLVVGAIIVTMYLPVFKIAGTVG
jgi:type IV pilus assembly protein PilC